MYCRIAFPALRFHRQGQVYLFDTQASAVRHAIRGTGAIAQQGCGVDVPIVTAKHGKRDLDIKTDGVKTHLGSANNNIIDVHDVYVTRSTGIRGYVHVIIHPYMGRCTLRICVDV